MKTEYRSVDQMEQELLDLQSLRARMTARELELVRELDVAQVANLDGSKTLGEWLAGLLDMEPKSATRLARLARSIDPRLEAELADGEVTAVQSEGNVLRVHLRDWRQRKLTLHFEDVMAYENFGIEGADLSHVACEAGSELRRRTAAAIGEAVEEAKCIAFVTAWSDRPLLRVLARSCEVREAG